MTLGARTDPMVPSLYRVVARTEETHDTVSLALTSADATPTAAFLPGQFSMLYAFGVGEAAISISGDATRCDRLVHTVRAVGATTRALCAARPGSMLGMRGPFGSSWPLSPPPGRDLVLVAGGLGLAPLRPMLYHALDNRQRFGSIHLLIGARARRELLFTREYADYLARGVEVLVTLDAADTDWHGHVGVVTRLIPQASFRPTQAVAVVCGPEAMMRFTIQALLDEGVAERDVYVSMERNMKCGIGLCGHCQYGADFVCKDGPVFNLRSVATRFGIQGI